MKVKFINKKHFLAVALSFFVKMFVIYIPAIRVKTKIFIDFSAKITIFIVYLDNTNIFLPKFA